MDDKEKVLSSLDSAIDQIIDTFKFHGVSIVGMSIAGSTPNFRVTIYNKSLKKDLKTTLDFVYWSLWTLIYGKYTEDKSELEISLGYSIVDEAISYES